MHTLTPSAKMRTDRATVGGDFASFMQAAARFMMVMVMIFSLESALAQQAAADCNSVTAAATAAHTNEENAIAERETRANQSIENAKSCIDRMLQLIRGMSPTMPSIQSISIQQIVQYLSNRVCAVATTQVTQAVGQVVAPINGAVGSAAGTVNGVVSNGTGGAVSGAVQTNGGGVSVFGSAGTSTTGTASTSSTSPSSSGSIWSRIGCVFGSGSGCN